MSIQVKKTHLALKHRGTTTILPGESIAAFDALHRDLISELTPNCVLADNIVATIARLTWRKQNLATFRKAVYVRFNYEKIMRREFSRMQPGQAFPPELRKLPPELQGLLEPTDANSAEQIDAIRQVDAIRDVARKELGDAAFALAEIGEKATIDGLMNDLEPQERLNAMIEKSLKRLLLVKGLESISASSSSSAPKRLAGPPGAPSRVDRSMRVRAKKSHPALKHGGYAATVVLPGESAAEFEKLHRGLIADFNADGALEEDIVADLAGRLWRKQNLATYRAAEAARKHYAEIIIREVERLPPPPIECGEYTEKEMSSALEFYGGGRSASRKEIDPAERENAIRAADEIARNELGDMYELAKMADTVTIACLVHDLEVEERLDAMIDKCIKRLLLAKGLKSISASSSSAPPKRLAVRTA